MSASVVRDPRAGVLAGPPRLAAFLAAVLLSLVAAVAAGARAPGDTGRVVQRVRIGPGGIQVERTARADSAGDATLEVRTGGRRVARVDVSTDDSTGDDGAVTVRAGDGSRRGAIVVDTGDDAMVRLFADARVAAGETFPGDVVAVFGSADVSGTVEGDVVAVFGSVRLHPGARVAGDAVAIGGGLDQPAGVEVGGQSISIGGLLPGWRVPVTTVLLTVVLAGWFATLFLAWLLSLLMSGPMLRVGAAAARHGAGSFFLGLLSAPFLLIVFGVLVLVSVIGGPVLAVPTALLGLLVPAIGQVAGSYVLGCRLLRRRPGEGGLMAPVFAGSLLVALLFLAAVALSVPAGLARSLSLFFAMLGVLLGGVLATLGTGAMLISLMGTRPEPAPAPAPTGTPAA